MIRDSLDKYLDKQKRPVLGLFCYFLAEKLIILQVFGKIMVKSGQGGGDKVRRQGTVPCPLFIAFLTKQQ